jgi:uncharacterized membrane protein (UPF0127 family)
MASGHAKEIGRRQRVHQIFPPSIPRCDRGDTGMLFVFQQPITVDFWMKDTVVPLDILFIKSDGTVATIALNCVPYSLHQGI